MKTFGFEIKKMFFDRPAVIDAVDRAEVRVLGRFGAFVRRRARSLIRRSKRKVSLPGEPPRSHSPEPNLRTILFAYNQRTHSVIVGPVYLNQSRSARTYVSQRKVPRVLEKGGTLQVREVRYGKRWRTPGRRTPEAGQPKRVRSIRIAPRPYMVPALAAEADNFPDLWAGSVGA